MEGKMVSNGGPERKSTSRPSVTRRELMRQLALGVGAAALLSAKPTFAAENVASAADSVARQVAPPAILQGVGTITVYSALNESTNNAFIAAYKAAVPGADAQLLP
jgi:hypothetical protein